VEQIEGYLANKWGVNHTFKNHPFGICSEIEVSVNENAPNSTIIDTINGNYTDTPTSISDWRIENGKIFEYTFSLDSVGILTVNDNTYLDYNLVSAYHIEVSVIANGVRVYGEVRIHIL
jgi:hypothetical protein